MLASPAAKLLIQVTARMPACEFLDESRDLKRNRQVGGEPVVVFDVDVSLRAKGSYRVFEADTVKLKAALQTATGHEWNGLSPENHANSHHFGGAHWHQR